MRDEGCGVLGEGCESVMGVVSSASLLSRQYVPGSTGYNNYMCAGALQ